jgi:hypothetical protein
MARNFIREHCGADVGTERTWREAQKLWAQYYDRSEVLPGYLPHCERTGGHVANAARMYVELHMLAEFSDRKEWHFTYLAYQAGRAYASLGQTELARVWLRKAREFRSFEDSAVQYYANQASEELDRIGAAH